MDNEYSNPSLELNFSSFYWRIIKNDFPIKVCIQEIKPFDYDTKKGWIWYKNINFPNI